jgi:hypothetical protein
MVNGHYSELSISHSLRFVLSLTTLHPYSKNGMWKESIGLLGTLFVRIGQLAYHGKT